MSEQSYASYYKNLSLNKSRYQSHDYTQKQKNVFCDAEDLNITVLNQNYKLIKESFQDNFRAPNACLNNDKDEASMNDSKVNALAYNSEISKSSTQKP